MHPKEEISSAQFDRISRRFKEVLYAVLEKAGFAMLPDHAMEEAVENRVLGGLNLLPPPKEAVEYEIFYRWGPRLCPPACADPRLRAFCPGCDAAGSALEKGGGGFLVYAGAGQRWALEDSEGRGRELHKEFRGVGEGRAARQKGSALWTPGTRFLAGSAGIIWHGP